METKIINDLKETINKYEYIKSETLVNIFKENHLYFPDFVHRFILLNLVKKYLFNKDLMSKFTDEYLYRLRSYNFFSIYLLEKAIKDYNLDIKAHEYKNLFLRFYLFNDSKFKDAKKILETLDKYDSKEPIKEESINVCLNEFSSIYYTPKGYLDGISLSIFKESIVATFNIVELKELGNKYNVIVPRRINKSQLIGLLTDRLLLNEEEKKQIESIPIAEICAFAKTKGFKISNDLKKQDIVEFIIYSLSKYHEDTEKDLYNYDFTLDGEFDPDIKVVQEEILVNDQGLPTSSELVDRPEDVVPKTIERDYKNEEVQLEENDEKKSIDDTINDKNSIQSEQIVQGSEDSNITLENSKKSIINETSDNDNDAFITDYKEELKPIEIEKTPSEYYDDTVDREIRDIIRKYYKRKGKKDVGFRFVVILLLILILTSLAYIILKYLNII